jgi:hypothetical protein
MSSVIKIKRGTTTQWNNSLTPLQLGELGLDTTLNRIKVGNGTSLWSTLPYISYSLNEITEIAQDGVANAITGFISGTDNIQVSYNDSLNKLVFNIGPNVITTDALDNRLGDPTTGYVPISLLANADGVATLDANAYVPDEQINPNITRDTELSSAISSAISTEVTNRNSAISTAISDLVNSAPSTLNTLKELSDALGSDPNFATTISTNLGTKVSKTGPNLITSGAIDSIPLSIKRLFGQTADLFVIYRENDNILASIDKDGNAQFAKITKTGGSGNEFLKADGSVDTNSYLTTGVASTTYLSITNASSTYAPLTSPTISNATFTGTTSGITKSMVGLGNVDNTSDVNKPISTATKDYVDKLTYGTAISGTAAYTVDTADKYKIFEVTNGSEVTITIPNDASDVAFPIGSTIEFRQMGAGRLKFVATSPAVLVSTDSYIRTRVQYSSAVIEKRSSNSWILVGDIDA